MGMDVHGKSGNYFHNNIHYWHPLATYIEEVAPQIASHNPYWHSNDGGGLNSTDSLALADKLQEEIDSGRCHEYADLRPPDPVEWADGKTTRFARLFSVANVQNFVHFLRESEGFWIS